MKKTITRRRIHPAWINTIALCMIMAGTYGILINCIGVLFTAIMEDTGISNGDLSVYYTIRNLTGAAVVVLTVKLFLNKNAKIVTACLSGIMALSIGAMAFFTKTYHWYIAGVFTGIGQSCIYTITSIVTNNWFKSKNGLALGLSMSASGTFSAIFSPVVSAMILAFGWRISCIIMMAISLSITLPACIFMLRRDCEGRGYEPIGSTEEVIVKRAEKKEVLSKPAAYIFMVLIIYGLVGSIYAPIDHQIAVFGNSIGFGITFGAILTSCTMVGNIVGKLSVGALSDRIGVFHALRISLALVFWGLLILCTFIGQKSALMIGAFLYGITYAFGIAQSLLMFEIYGPDIYKQKLAVLQSIGGIIGALMSTAVGYIYDYFNNFTPIFAYAMCASVIQILICTYISIYTKKRNAHLS